MICSSAEGLVSAFKVPQWGEVADEVPPSWLVRLIQIDRITINTLGGLTYHDEHGSRGCLPQDLIILRESGEIDFCTASEFEHTYTLLDERHAA